MITYMVHIDSVSGKKCVSDILTMDMSDMLVVRPQTVKFQ